jgi:glycine cleavage system H lipoate-binding protein
MEAGILSYLLCDREFDCDHCPLDEAMRSHFPTARRQAGDGAAAETRSALADSRSLFSPDHLEITVREDGSCRLGLEPGLASVLPPVKSIVLPRKGERISPDTFCCWLIFEGGTLPLKLPFGGTVDAVNPELPERPHLVNGRGRGEGWLFDFTPAEPGAAEGLLLSAADASSGYIADGDTFRHLAAECLHPDRAAVGRTLHDGGRLVDDLASMIGPVKYLEMIRRVYLSGHQGSSQK